MRVFATSDLHTDYELNARWIRELSLHDHQQDLLVVAGDVSDSLMRLERSLSALVARFARVLFVPGNHELWVLRDDGLDSLRKFELVRSVALQSGADVAAFHGSGLSVVPVQGWYDSSFGIPSPQLQEAWMDFRACRWPAHWGTDEVARHFAGMNTEPRPPAGNVVISFSHFLPRIDLMPPGVPERGRMLYPVLGSALIEARVRALGSRLHVYGHSHINRDVVLDGTRYLNAALAYPHEPHLSSRVLRSIFDDQAQAHPFPPSHRDARPT